MVVAALLFAWCVSAGGDFVDRLNNINVPQCNDLGGRCQVGPGASHGNSCCEGYCIASDSVDGPLETLGFDTGKEWGRCDSNGGDPQHIEEYRADCATCRWRCQRNEYCWEPPNGWDASWKRTNHRWCEENCDCSVGGTVTNGMPDTCAPLAARYDRYGRHWNRESWNPISVTVPPKYPHTGAIVNMGGQVTCIPGKGQANCATARSGNAAAAAQAESVASSMAMARARSRAAARPRAPQSATDFGAGGTYLFAAVGVAAIAVTLWKCLAPKKDYETINEATEQM